jgi:hypothetical protein
VRRVRALVNRAFGTDYNVKRIQRVMALHDWTLPPRTRRRTGRDYLVGAGLSTAAAVLEQIPAWIVDYNSVAPLSALRLQYPDSTDSPVTPSPPSVPKQRRWTRSEVPHEMGCRAPRRRQPKRPCPSNMRAH